MQAPEPSGPAWFVDEASLRGIEFDWVSGAEGNFHIPEIVGGGAALFDMDNDGDLDAYIVQAGGLTVDASERPGNRLFENDGNGHFSDVSADSGADDQGYGMGVATGDYDGDGDVDLYVTNVGPNVLLRNDGGGTFTDVTSEAGTGDAGTGASATFFDADGDGDLDLFVTNYVNWSFTAETPCYNEQSNRDYCSPKSYQAPSRDVLYRNEGDGTFTDISQEAGLGAGFGNGLGVLAGDFNNDGRLDVFVANDGNADQLWANQGNGRFADIATLLGCAFDTDGIAKAGMGVTAADIDDDGDLDLQVCNLRSETDSMFINQGGHFEDATSRGGLAAATKAMTRFGMGWVDFDNDGRLDLYQANGKVMNFANSETDDPYAEVNFLARGIWRNDRPMFEPIKPAGGTAQRLVATSRGAAFGDIDNDGGIDILVVNRDHPAYLLRNVAANRGNWIGIRATAPNGADVLNAQVSFSIGDRRITRDVRTGSSYMSANSPRIHMGLGDAAGVQTVSIKWPDGRIEQFGDLPANRIHTLQRGSGMRGR